LSSISTIRISTAISNTIEVFVGRLRKKLGVDVIETVRGLGYIAAAKA
jgi:two-component system OmpR family response regulator